MSRRLRTIGAALLLAWLASPTKAVTLSVGTGAGCDHATLQAAFDAIQGLPGVHEIHLRKGNYATPDGMLYAPTVGQAGVYLEGGYAECTDAAPSGDPTLDADRAVFDAAGGVAISALRLFLDGRVGTFQMRRIVVTGGDAIDSGNEFRNTGGGLQIRGPASVLLARGASIRSNNAGRGGGVALIGGPVNSGSTPAKIDFYLDEGAQVTGNVATGQGGGIYCGGAAESGQPAVNRHGSIVFVDGLVGFNEAAVGGGFYCYGSVEGGGGLQPRPRAGASALLLGNRSRLQPCAAGNGTLDASVAMDGEGYRTLGAADGSDGMLAIVINEGVGPGLCLDGSFQLGTTTRPDGPSRFRLQNLYVSGQRGEGPLGLLLARALKLRVQPSGPYTACDVFGTVPCVSFEDNVFEAVDDAPDVDTYLIQAAAFDSTSAEVELARAMVRLNTVRSALFVQIGGTVRLESSIVDENRVLPVPSSEIGTSLFLVGGAGTARVEHSTVRFDTPLDRFFGLYGAASAAAARASIFASSADPAPANVGGSAPPSNFTREWCGLFQRIDDVDTHTEIPDPTTHVFKGVPSSLLGLEQETYEPAYSLVDWCTPSVATDFHGNEFGSRQFFPGAVSADIGAVELQRPLDVIFADGWD